MSLKTSPTNLHNDSTHSHITYDNQGNITSPIGFQAYGAHIGLRRSLKDFGMIYSDVPASVAAVYTTNLFQAAPLDVTRDSIATEGKLQAVVVNSACANAATGAQGHKNARQMRDSTAEKLGVDSHLVAVASTGVIGKQLPMDIVEAGIQSISLGPYIQNGEDFNSAILTTDTTNKKTCYKAQIDGKTVTMAGAAKGSGMIEPNMATMLAFITSDCAVEPDVLEIALREVTNSSFNQITVDGDTSTNDMVLVMANGQAENEMLTPQHSQWDVFLELLTACCQDLAQKIARDGEGATKLIEAYVTGGATIEQAQKVAKQIVGSNLVKTAVHGCDANWGRIIGAVGQTSDICTPQSVDIAIGPHQMLIDNEPQNFSEEKAKEYLHSDVIEIHVNLHSGDASGKAWGCDLSYDYVKINASYRT